MRRPAHLLRTAVLLGAAILGLGAGPRPAQAGPGHRVGEPCRSEHTYPVRIVSDPAGGLDAVFALAGGAMHGSVALSGSLAADLVAHPRAHVSDVQLGSYEPAPDRTRVPACRVAATYHLDCPVAGTLDELCFEWDGPPARSHPVR